MVHFNYINIAELNFVIKTENPISISQNFEQFISVPEPEMIDCMSEICEVENLPEMAIENCVGIDYDNHIFSKKDGDYLRIYHKDDGQERYAVSNQKIQHS